MCILYNQLNNDLSFLVNSPNSHYFLFPRKGLEPAHAKRLATDEGDEEGDYNEEGGEDNGMMGDGARKRTAEEMEGGGGYGDGQDEDDCLQNPLLADDY